MLGRTNTGGGGGGLNFQVVGNPQPTNPKENTIWIDTDTKISGYVFSATQPSEQTEGVVWITTGTSSEYEFNALKKNFIQICPIKAQQYIDGAWVFKKVKSYQNGGWNDWIFETVLYNQSDGDNTEITGGWTVAAKALASGGATTKPTKETISNGSLRFKLSEQGGGIAYCSNKIDLTGVNTIEFYGTIYSAHSSSKWAALAVWSSLGSYSRENVVAQVTPVNDKTAKTYTLDVSSLPSGKYTVGFYMYGSESYVTMARLKLIGGD